MPPKKRRSPASSRRRSGRCGDTGTAVSPALGQHGVNIMEFVKAYNAAAESQAW